MSSESVLRPIKAFVEHPLVRPGKVEDRLYQRRIVERAKKRNTLVVLPTALGKTVIAALLTAHRLHKHGGKVVFLAPTRPLAHQHYQRFLEHLNLSEHEMAVLTGRDPQPKRAELFKRARVVFATPQTIRNDVADGAISLRDVTLMIFDEAHRARGRYAYVELARRYVEESRDPLILALTASPGGSEEEVRQVCENLFIEAIEVRTDDDDDVKPYIQPIKVRWVKVKLPEEYVKVRDCLKQMFDERVEKLRSMGLLQDVPKSRVTKGKLIELNEELARRIDAGEGSHLYHVKAQTTAAISIAHMIELIESQDAEVLKAFIEETVVKDAEEGSRGHKSILADPLFAEAKFYLERAVKVRHPKLKVLAEVVEEQLRLRPQSRVIVFTQYRETARIILDALSKVEGVKPAKFIGQASRGRVEGMSQREQQEVLAGFKAGAYNVLVATSIAEEGLDIPEVEHVIFYEPVPSEIRFIQRRGRTGRRVPGKVTVLMTEKSCDEHAYWASFQGVRRMKAILRRLDERLSREVKVPRRREEVEEGGSKLAREVEEYLEKLLEAKPVVELEPKAAHQPRPTVEARPIAEREPKTIKQPEVSFEAKPELKPTVEEPPKPKAEAKPRIETIGFKEVPVDGERLFEEPKVEGVEEHGRELVEEPVAVKPMARELSTIVTSAELKVRGSKPWAKTSGVAKAAKWLHAKLTSKPVRIERLIEEGVREGFSREALEEAIKRMISSGEAYQPAPGYLARVYG